MFTSTKESENWSDFQQKYGSSKQPSPNRRGLVRNVSGSSLRMLAAAVGAGGDKRESRNGVARTKSSSSSPTRSLMRSGSARSLSLSWHKKDDTAITAGGRRRRPRKLRSNDDRSSIVSPKAA